MDRDLRPYIAELVGTFALVFVSAGAVCAAYLPISVKIDVTGIVLAQGLILAVLLTATLNVSGGYLNPAVTIALWTVKRLEGRRVLYLLGAQLLGSVLAGLMLRTIVSDDVFPFGVPHLMEPLQSGTNALTLGALATATGLELVLTFLFTFVIFATTIDPRTPRLSSLGLGLVPALAMVALALVGFRFTGASLNPARAFGPFLWEGTIRPGDWREHVLVYWLAPLAGAVAGAWVYVKLILPEAVAPTPAPPREAVAAPPPPAPPPPVRTPARSGRGRKKK